MAPRITREAIVDAALVIGDDSGLEAISMRAVASALGIQAMSLYHHVANKAELLDALHERLITEMRLPAECQDWRDLLRRSARAYRDLATAHPKLFVLLATRPISTPAAFAHISPALRLIEEAGIPPRTQLFVVEAFFTSLNGYLLAEVGPVPGHPDVMNPDLDGITDVSPDMLRLMNAMQDAGEGDHYFADLFEAYIDVLIAGLDTIVGEV